MGLLDDLKKEAEKKEAQQQEQGVELQSQEDYYEQLLKPAMRRAHEYFVELVDTLNTVKPDVTAPYPVDPEKGRPIGLKHGGYSFVSDDEESPRKFIVACDCALEERLEFYVQTKAAVDRYSALLDSHNFPYFTKNELDEAHEVVNAGFVLEGPLRLQIRFIASAENKCIYVDLYNLDPQPKKRYKLPPEKLTDALLDRLARILMHEETQLVETRISDETRAELSRKVEEEKRRVAKAQAEAEAEREAERLAEEEARLINRAKRSVTGGIKKILSRD